MIDDQLRVPHQVVPVTESVCFWWTYLVVEADMNEVSVLQTSGL